MLKKHDLAKQFELLTKQEIKNFQDEKNSFRNHLNEIQKSLGDLKQETIEKAKKLTQSLDSNSFQMAEIEGILGEFMVKMQGELSDLKISNAEIIKSMGENLKIINVLTHKHVHQEKRIQNLYLLDAESRKEYVLHENEVERKLDKQEIHCRNALEKFKNEILGKASEVEPLKEELFSKIDTVIKDFNHHLQNIQKDNQKTYIIEKNIENLYLQIERTNLRIESTHGKT